jgi:hypothetical protein
MFRYAYLYLLKTNDDEYYIILSVMFWSMLHVALFTYLMRFSKQTWRHTLRKVHLLCCLCPGVYTLTILIHRLNIFISIKNTDNPHKTRLNFSSFLRTTFFALVNWRLVSCYLLHLHSATRSNPTNRVICYILQISSTFNQSRFFFILCVVDLRIQLTGNFRDNYIF